MDNIVMMKEWQIADCFAMHWYGTEFSLYNISRKRGVIRCNRSEACVILLINQFHRVDKVWQNLSTILNVSISSQTAMESTISYIEKLASKGIIVEGNISKRVYGEKNRFYPLFASIELTNICNFHCTHCYKEAKIDHGSFLPFTQVKRIANSLAPFLYSIDITGGEATLHPHFSEIIDLFHVPVLNLITNGSVLYKLDDSVLKRFSQIQISLYGYSDDEYLNNTGSAAFSKICDGLSHLVKIGVYTTVAVILKHESMDSMEKCMELLEKLGVYNLRFGLALRIGRNEHGSAEWDLSSDRKLQFHRMIDELSHKYPKFDIGNIDTSPVMTANEYNAKEPSIVCGAGDSNICISEKGTIRPCVMFPEKYFGSYSIEEYVTSIENGKHLSYKNSLLKCAEQFNEKGRSIKEICPYGIE